MKSYNVKVHEIGGCSRDWNFRSFRAAARALGVTPAPVPASLRSRGYVRIDGAGPIAKRPAGGSGTRADIDTRAQSDSYIVSRASDALANARADRVI